MYISAARRRLGLIRCYHKQDDRLDIELANIRQSRIWLARQEGEEENTLHLAYIDLLAPYLYRHNLYTELLQWCEDGLCSYERLRRNSGSLLFLKGQTLNALGRWAETRTSYQEAIQASEGHNPSLHARAVLALGQLEFNQGTYPLALDTLTRAEQLLTELSEYELIATIHVERANYYLNKGDLNKALALYLEAEQKREQAGNTKGTNLLMLGVVYRKKKEYEYARVYLQQLLTSGERRRDDNTIATASHHLAWIAFDQDDFVTARTLCGKALALYEDFGDRRGLSDALEQLGCITLAERRPQEALLPLQRSLLLRQELHNQQGVASSLSHLAITYLSMRRRLTALRCFGLCLLAYRRIGMLSRQRLKIVILRFFQHFWESWKR